MIGATNSLILASMYGLSGDGEFLDAAAALLLQDTEKTIYHGHVVMSCY